MTYNKLWYSKPFFCIVAIFRKKIHLALGRSIPIFGPYFRRHRPWRRGLGLTGIRWLCWHWRGRSHRHRSWCRARAHISWHQGVQYYRSPLPLPRVTTDHSSPLFASSSIAPRAAPIFVFEFESFDSVYISYDFWRPRYDVSSWSLVYGGEHIAISYDF